MRLSTHLLLPALVMSLCAQALPAQVTTGSLCGQVTDEAGNPIVGAHVLLESPALFQPRTYTTDAKGEYRALLLPVGNYTVKVSASGMLSKVASDVRVGVGTNLSIPFVLRFQKANESATVEVISNMAQESKSDDKVSVNYSASDLFRLPVGVTSNGACWITPGITGYGTAPRIQGSNNFNTEAYNPVTEQPFQVVQQYPLSTFSADVDTASYSNLRRYLEGGSLPPHDSVRIEEWINYFHYAYAEPSKKKPVSVQTEVLQCPWNLQHHLVRVGLQARRLQLDALPARNLVFLVDVSGSMGEENKLPLVKAGLKRLCQTLRDNDQVSIVVYASGTGVALEPTSGKQKARILEVLDHLEAGGSTNGEGGIQLAYEVARRIFQKGADNRVVLCTDGDFNVGVSDQGSLVRLIEQERQSGVFLTCLGFGMGNLKDATLEQLADKGNGHYGYIDSMKEMEKFFGAGGASLITVAKDVKIQVEFNPTKVQAYRLLGYENRKLAAEDFKNDAKDAGEMNVGHSVTALYEVVPPGEKMASPSVEPLKYQTVLKALDSGSKELLTVKIRYKQPDGSVSRGLEFPVQDQVLAWDQASPDARWAASVATFGLVLLDSTYKQLASLDLAEKLATSSLGPDEDGLRKEMLGLITKARALTPKPAEQR